MKNKIKHTTHSTYRCQYHIVFAPKYRRKAIYGQLKADIGQILRKLCEQKGVEIIEATAMSDHIHMLVSIPPYLSIAQFMGYLKGKSTLMHVNRLRIRSSKDLEEIIMRKQALFSFEIQATIERFFGFQEI